MLCCMAAWLTGVLLAAVPCTQVYTTWLIEGTRSKCNHDNPTCPHHTNSSSPLRTQAPQSPAAAIDADYQSAFIPLDTDKAGYAAGSMTVGLELVAC